jgi:hypothetical protein
MTRRHRNYSEKIRQIRLLNFKDIQNYYAVELSKAEKIIVVQLSYTAEINDKLLDFDQMKDRKQRSAINAVLNLIHKT